jgi:sugar (pentulose or hexulose) kinase
VSNAVYLGIDIGTSGIRGSCINDAGEEIINNRIPLASQAVKNDGSSEQDPNIWLQQFDQLITEISHLLHELDSSYSIKSIAVDGTSSTLIACSEDGSALSPAMMYNDQQSKTQAEIISHFAPGESAVHGASSSLAKALFLLQKHPTTKILCHQANWLSASLTGQYRISDENNCLKLGYDSITQSWPEWITHNSENAVLPAELLPQVVAPGTKLGRIKPELIKKYMLGENCCLVAGTTDSNAAVLATGANKLGDAVTSLGSTLVLKLFSDRPLFNAEYGIYSHRLNGSWLVGGASNSGGSVLLQHFTPQEIDKLSKQVVSDRSTGLNYYPLPATGERFPINDSNKPSLIKPRPDSDAIFFQGLLEGIANVEAEGYKKLTSLGAVKPQRIYTAGGGSKNEAWRKIRERMTATTVVTATHTEASYGSALLARQGYAAQVVTEHAN